MILHIPFFSLFVINGLLYVSGQNDHPDFPCAVIDKVYCCTPRMQAWCSSFCQDVRCGPPIQARSAGAVFFTEHQPTPTPPPFVPAPLSFEGMPHIEEINHRESIIAHSIDITAPFGEEDETDPAAGQARATTQRELEFTTISSSQRKAEIAEPEPVAVCGAAPNYTPCVPLFDANQRMQTCCQQKNLPPGCLKLCQYKVTQAEVKSAFDSGACGLLHIAPFIECAASGQNNVQCCRDSGLIASTGVQCEPFCFPSGPGGLGLLGLHHIVCGGIIEKMIACHHSGLKS